MTKNQLITILLKRAEINANDSDYFFEYFVEHLNSKIQPGEIHFIKGVGYFYQCLAKLNDDTKPAAPGKFSDAELKVKIILCHEEFELVDDIRKTLVIIAPENDLMTLKGDEEYFSLNFGKPVVSFSKRSGDIQLTDHIKNLKIKASNLLKEIEYLDNRKSDEEIVVIKKKSLNLSSDINTIVPENSNATSDPENEFSKKSPAGLPADSAFDLYYHSRISQRKRDDRGLPWDYGRDVFGMRNSPAGLSSKKDGAGYFTDTRKFVLGGTKEKEKDKKTEEVEDVSEPTSQLKAFIREPHKSTKSPDELKGTESGHSKEKFKRDFASIKDFSEVKTKTVKLEEILNKRQQDTLTETAYIKPYKKSSPPEKIIEPLRKSYLKPAAVVISGLIILAAAAYFLIESGILFSSETDELVVTIKRPSSVRVIERDDLIPVTYPYSKSDETMSISGLSPTAFDKQIEKTEEKKIVETKPVETNPVETKKEIKTETPKIVTQKTEKIIPEEKKVEKTTPPEKEPVKETKTESQYIFPYKDYYVVQIGIYDSYSTADTEADKFRNMGYNAFVEVAQVSGQTAYRLRVGDFTSEKQAERFSKKYR